MSDLRPDTLIFGSIVFFALFWSMVQSDDPCGPGSHASHEAATASSPPVSIPVVVRWP